MWPKHCVTTLVRTFSVDQMKLRILYYYYLPGLVIEEMQHLPELWCGWYLRICKNKVSKWKVFKNSIVSINVGNLSGEYKERLRPRLFMSVNPVLMGPFSFNHVIWCIWMYLSRRNWCISTHWFYVQHLGTGDWIPEVAWRHEGMDLIETEMMISRSFLCDFVWYLLCDFSIIIIRLLFVI